MIAALGKYKRILMIVGVLFVVFIIYSYFKGGDEADQNQAIVATPTNNAAGTQNPVGQQFFNQLLTLENIKLDDRVFGDPRFQSLQDFSQPLPDEPQGRPNPFAPIGVDVAGSVTTGGGGSYNLNFSSGTSTSQ